MNPIPKYPVHLLIVKMLSSDMKLYGASPMFTDTRPVGLHLFNRVLAITVTQRLCIAMGLLSHLLSYHLTKNK